MIKVGLPVGIETFDASKRIQLDQLFKIDQVEADRRISSSVAEERGKYGK